MTNPWVILGMWVVFWILGTWVMRAGGICHILIGAQTLATTVALHPAHAVSLMAAAAEMMAGGYVMWLVGHWRFARKFGYWKSPNAHHVWNRLRRAAAEH